ncbi:Phosphonoacetaldehyde hydrolase [uncultured Eubacterium sp.]|nr:Phosphonoacetaldehyde hydrolase [uncultured Eubacterium sp.]
MKKIEAVIFDWAGTTVDFGSFAPVQAFIKAFEEFGITPTVDEVRAPMGMLKWNHIHTMMQMPRIQKAWAVTHGREWTLEDVDAVYQKSESGIMEILQDFAQPKPFVLDTVKTLRERDIKIGSTTGYTDEMMSIVVPEAAKRGYQPDTWFSPDSVSKMGRPYPFMIFKNLEALQITSVSAAIKVGDTVADIKEGKNAGLISVGIVEGSSVMALSEAEYGALSTEEKSVRSAQVTKIYQDCGADYVIDNMRSLLNLIDQIERQ